MMIYFLALTRYVATNGQDSNACTSSGSPCKSLSYAVSQAVTGDTISIGAGTFPSTNNIEVNVAKNLVISGAGSSQTIIDLNKQGKTWKYYKHYHYYRLIPTIHSTILFSYRMLAKIGAFTL